VASKGGKAAPAKAPASKESKAALEPAPIDAPLTQEQKLLHVAQLRLEAANKVEALTPTPSPCDTREREAPVLPSQGRGNKWIGNSAS
jgi:hypothetical protein